MQVPPGITAATGWRAVPDRRYLLVSLILSFTGGFADAGSFVLARSFTGHITGNSLLLAVGIVERHWAVVLSCFVAIVAFLAGTASGIAWPHAPVRSPCQRLSGPIAVELALVGLGLGAEVLLGPQGRTLFLAAVCFALGLQNGVLGKIESVSFHTTFITGLSTTLVASLIAGKPDPKRGLLPPIIGCFLAGALCGAWAVRQFDAFGFAAVTVPLVLGCLLALTDRSP